MIRLIRDAGSVGSIIYVLIRARQMIASHLLGLLIGCGFWSTADSVTGVVARLPDGFLDCRQISVRSGREYDGE